MNLRKKLFSFEFIWVKIDKVSNRKSWIFPLPSISIVLLRQVCVFLLKIVKKWWKRNLGQTIVMSAKWRMHNQSPYTRSNIPSRLELSLRHPHLTMSQHTIQRASMLFDRALNGRSYRLPRLSAELTAMFGLLIGIGRFLEDKYWERVKPLASY